MTLTNKKTVLFSTTGLIAGLLFVMLSAGTARAQDGHQHHPPHNMILLGTTEIFASHIVYKQPHNFQVILKIQFDEKTKVAYQTARDENTESLFIFLLHSMDISQIQTMESISGKLLFEGPDGQRNIILENVVIDKDHFKVVYFDEVPLSLVKTNP